MTICSFDTPIFNTKSGTFYLTNIHTRKILTEYVIFHNLYMSKYV